MCGSSAVSIPTPVSDTTICAPSPLERTVTVTRPPRGVNLSALPTRLPITWPIRCGSWRIRRGCFGSASRRSMPRRRAAGPACSTADSTHARRSSGRRSRRTRPESSFDSSRRFVASQSRRSICWRLDSRNSVRVSGSVAAPSRSSSLNVRSAAIGVRSSCETSARKSRLRSRSRRMISTLSPRRAAIMLNWRDSSASSVAPVRARLAGTRRE